MPLRFPFHTFWHLFTTLVQGVFCKTHNPEFCWILSRPELYKTTQCFHLSVQSDLIKYIVDFQTIMLANVTLHFTLFIHLLIGSCSHAANQRKNSLKYGGSQQEGVVVVRSSVRYIEIILNCESSKSTQVECKKITFTVV